MDIVNRSKTLMLGVGAAPVMYLMIGLSVASVAVILERAWFYRKTTDRDLERLARDLDRMLSEDGLDAARARIQASPSIESRVVAAGLHQAARGPEAAAQAMAGATALQRVRLEKRLAFLGTLGNNAPFIGLFGTVIGIVQAFDKLGDVGAGAAGGEVMGSIAEALVATAIGLAVAIPAVAAFNFFQRRIKETVARTEGLTRVLLAYLEGQESDRRAAIAEAQRPERIATHGFIAMASAKGA